MLLWNKLTTDRQTDRQTVTPYFRIIIRRKM